MQVRTIEFQESFARVPVEQSRQHSVLLREPNLARDQAARANAEAHMLDLSRPVQTTETEGVIIRSDQEKGFEQPPRRDRRSGQENEPSDERRQVQQGRYIDVTV